MWFTGEWSIFKSTLAVAEQKMFHLSLQNYTFDAVSILVSIQIRYIRLSSNITLAMQVHSWLGTYILQLLLVHTLNQLFLSWCKKSLIDWRKLLCSESNQGLTDYRGLKKWLCNLKNCRKQSKVKCWFTLTLTLQRVNIKKCQIQILQEIDFETITNAQNKYEMTSIIKSNSH